MCPFLKASFCATKVDLFVGIVGGGAFEYARSAYSNPEKVRIRRFRTAYDVSCVVFQSISVSLVLSDLTRRLPSEPMTTPQLAASCSR